MKTNFDNKNYTRSLAFITRSNEGSKQLGNGSSAKLRNPSPDLPFIYILNTPTLLGHWCLLDHFFTIISRDYHSAILWLNLFSLSFLMTNHLKSMGIVYIICRRLTFENLVGNIHWTQESKYNALETTSYEISWHLLQNKTTTKMSTHLPITLLSSFAGTLCENIEIKNVRHINQIKLWP